MSDRKSIRVMSLFIAILSVFFSLVPIASAENSSPPQVTGIDAACVINAEHREVVIDNAMKETVYPASTVKLMTALVAYEYFKEDLDVKITVTEEMLAASVGRNLKLETRERIRVTDLLHAMLVGGYNDASVILAISTAGSIEAFCTKMDTKAKELGANNTHYTNPTGLHDDAMTTTAYDTALIGLAILENETLLSITKAVKYTIPETNKSEDRTIYNRNILITTNMTEEYYYSHAEGMNSGATDEGGDCVVTAGRLDGLSYVCVVMGGRPQSENDDTNYACIAAKDLLRYALISYEVKTLYSEKQRVGTIPVRFSATEESVGIKPLRDLSSLLFVGVDLETEVQFETNIFPELLEAPIKEGDVVGSIQAIYNGKVLDSTDLITADTIDSHGFLIFMYRVKQVTQHPVFIITLLIAVAGIVYILLKRFPINKNKDRHKRNRYF